MRGAVAVSSVGFYRCHGRVYPGTFLQPLQHVAQHVRCERESCGPEVDGPLEALDTPDG